MAYLTLQLARRPADAAIKELEEALGPLAEVREPPVVSYDPMSDFFLVVGFAAGALQVVDILSKWLGRTPKGNEAVIRLADGRELKLEANTDPDEFVKQLKAALKDFYEGNQDD